MFAEVLVEYTNKVVDKTFTYLVPDKFKSIIKVGMKVKVPFAKRIINGIVMSIKDVFNEDYELKEIKELITPEFVLNQELLSLGKYLQEKTLCSKIVAYQTMLPSSLKVKNQKNDFKKYDTYVSLINDNNKIEEYKELHKNRKTQIKILEELKEGKRLKKDFSSSAINFLLEENLIKLEKVQRYRIEINEETKNRDFKLSNDQIASIAQVKFNEPNTYLLYGVTGSGKTEVYMELMKKTIDSGKTAIMLLPEIALTTQMINRLYERFGNKVAVFHSSLSEGEKYDEYLKIYKEEVSIVVGTRSAIFTPLKNLGIIIIDEEHSDTYHQDTNPRYSAIDMAKFRIAYNKCPLVLGSATPTLESMVRAKQDVYKLLTMPNRINNQKLPLVTLVDMAEEMQKRHPVISELLEAKIKDRLKKEEQVILLLNRRGYSTIVTCQNCGYTYKCPHCDITLTYHKTSNNLRCHYCGYTKYLDKVCPDCNEDALNYLGLGTEKLEKTLQGLFPEARLIRMDVDTTIRKGSHEKIIEDFKEHKYDILLGTQMISKGLNFPLVTLVGVVNADSSLNIPDFRSGEKTFDLLYQVSGRSGRDKIPGEVIIQSYNPDNIYLKCVKDNSYDEFYNYEMNVRKKLEYPPYYYLVSVMLSSSDYDLLSKESNHAFYYLKNNLLKTSKIFGPTPASIFRVNNYYRMQILIKYKYDSLLIPTLKHLDEIYATNNKVQFMIDFNPSRF